MFAYKNNNKKKLWEICCFSRFLIFCTLIGSSNELQFSIKKNLLVTYHPKPSAA